MRTRSTALPGRRMCRTVEPVREDPGSGRTTGEAMNGKGQNEVRLWGAKETDTLGKETGSRGSIY